VVLVRHLRIPRSGDAGGVARRRGIAGAASEVPTRGTRDDNGNRVGMLCRGCSEADRGAVAATVARCDVAGADATGIVGALVQPPDELASAEVHVGIGDPFDPVAAPPQLVDD